MNRKARRAAEKKMQSSGDMKNAVAALKRAAEVVDPDFIDLAGVKLFSPGIGRVVRQAMANLYEQVARDHGPAGFYCPKTAAAAHEAGHVVIDTVQGEDVEKATIYFRRKLGWYGRTDSDGILPLTLNAPPATLIYRARKLLAGLVAEVAMDPDFREGSSVDELVMSQALAGLAADSDVETFWRTNVWDWVARTLSKHREPLEKIANHLYRHHTLRGAALEAFCAEIRAEAGRAGPASEFSNPGGIGAPDPEDPASYLRRSGNE